MLQWFRRRWLLSVVLVGVVLAGIGTATYFLLTREEIAESGEDPDIPPAKPQAPPDLQKFKDAYAKGVDALQRDDGAEAVQQLSSFDFGSRAVEEYRLYYLANAYELTGNAPAARSTLAQLWRRQPKLIHANDAGFHLAGIYATAGEASRSADVYATIARNAKVPQVAASARWNAVGQYLRAGDVAGALFHARNILIHHPRSENADEAAAVIQSLTGGSIPFTASERVERAIALMQSNDSQTALEELTALEPNAGHLRDEVRLQRGIALHLLKRYEDSNKVLEPLTSGAFKVAIPALRTTAKSYAIVASSINPIVIKNVKERKKVGTTKTKVGKGKKRRTVTKPKYQTVTKQVKLVDLAKKNKKDEYERLASERLKDLLSLKEVDANLRFEVLNTLVTRAEVKNQDDYIQELVPQIIKIDSNADPALQHFWDKGWAAYVRGDLATARKLFRFIADHYTHPNVRRQSEYWHARTIERLGLKAEAAKTYQELASAPYADLYAMHAVTLRGAKRVENKTNPLENSTQDWREIAEKSMPKELQLAYELTALSAMRDALQEIRRNARRENTRFSEALMADYYHATGSEVLMYRSLRKAWPQLATVEQDSAPAYFLRMYYPLKYGDEIDDHAKERGLDPNLVRALILQESYYNPKAKSRVGATGLMQLMPPTAKEHASRLGVPFAISRLENPAVNVRLGTYHLKMLVNMFSGNTYLAVASYNAGQGNVMKWRRAAPKKPMDEFIESIPFQETRNYVKRVTMLRSSYSRLTL